MEMATTNYTNPVVASKRLLIDSKKTLFMASSKRVIKKVVTRHNELRTVSISQKMMKVNLRTIQVISLPTIAIL